VRDARALALGNISSSRATEISAAAEQQQRQAVEEAEWRRYLPIAPRTMVQSVMITRYGDSSVLLVSSMASCHALNMRSVMQPLAASASLMNGLGGRHKVQVYEGLV
jgi:hypothetical protein